MPYKSLKQSAFLHIHHPKIAKRWDKHTTKKQWRRLVKKARRAKRTSS